MKRLSDKQRQILDYIGETTAARGYPPSVREIGAAVGLRSPSTVHTHLKNLAEGGFIQKDAHKTRAISISGENFARVPIVGRVTAGVPILAVEEISGYAPFDMGASVQECFALNVRGDSMINAGILDGDVVIVRRQQSAQNGDIVVAMIDDEATVKRFRMDGGKVSLIPENPAYQPIVADDVTILGKVAAVWRKYS